MASNWLRAILRSSNRPSNWLAKLSVLFVLGGLIGTATYFGLIPNVFSHGTRADLNRYPVFAPLKLTDRITIISPHLDDETLGLGGLIAQAREQGVPVSVIFMTNGDDFPIAAQVEFHTGYATPAQLISFGQKRQQEAIQALSKLGVAPDTIYFLGLPDRGLTALLSARYAQQPFTSLGTQVSANPYPIAYQPNVPYTGDAARAVLTSAINLTRPTLIFATMPDDVHKDHQATYAFIQQVAPNLITQPQRFYYLIHYHGYPVPDWVDPSLPLLPPTRLANDPWQVIFLSPKAISQKQQAVEAYKTQTRIFQLGRLMRSLVRSNELVTPGH